MLFGVDERGARCGAVATFPFAGSKGNNGRTEVDVLKDEGVMGIRKIRLALGGVSLIFFWF